MSQEKYTFLLLALTLCLQSTCQIISGMSVVCRITVHTKTLTYNIDN